MYVVSIRKRFLSFIFLGEPATRRVTNEEYWELGMKETSLFLVFLSNVFRPPFFFHFFLSSQQGAMRRANFPRKRGRKKKKNCSEAENNFRTVLVFSDQMRADLASFLIFCSLNLSIKNLVALNQAQLC